jgi:hypothetical protein
MFCDKFFLCASLKLINYSEIYSEALSRREVVFDRGITLKSCTLMCKCRGLLCASFTKGQWRNLYASIS